MIRSWPVLLLSLIFTPVVYAVSSPTHWLAELRNLKADYHHDLMSASHEAIQSSEGVLLLQVNPLGLRMSEDWPMDLEVVFDGQDLWQYDVALNQVSQYQSSHLKDSPLLQLFETPDWTAWDFNESAHCLKAPTCYLLKPPTPSEHFQGIRLGFSADKLMELQIIGLGGERHVYTFEQVQVNTQMPQHTFQFQAPPEADIMQVSG